MYIKAKTLPIPCQNTIGTGVAQAPTINAATTRAVTFHMALLSKGALKQKLWFFLLTLNEREYYLQLHLTFNLYTVEWGSGVGVLYCTPNYYSTADLSVVPVSTVVRQSVSPALTLPLLRYSNGHWTCLA